MGWLKQVPAWIWLLFGAVQVLRIAMALLESFGSFPSVIGIVVSSLAGGLCFGLAFCRWRYWSAAGAETGSGRSARAR
jgi:hypothetical protein